MCGERVSNNAPAEYRVRMVALYICVLLVWGAALARIDFAEHRLPDRLTLPAIPAGVVIVADLWPGQIEEAVRWAAVIVAIGVILALVADLGWGDVKLLAVFGVLAGGAGTISDSILTICIAGGAHVLIHLLVDGDRKAYIPFGPAILSGFVPVAGAMA